MFTGIVECIAQVKQVKKEGSNLRLQLQSPITSELKVDQSISHNGVCLTVERIHKDSYEVVAVEETLLKSNLGQLKLKDAVNLERCLKLNHRLDGHLVQGHVDTTAQVHSIKKRNGSWVFSFVLDQKSPLIVEKGSICVNGVSLTAFDVKDTSFQLTIIPYTYEHTNFKTLKEGSLVNIEFDLIGKYIQRLQQF